MKEKAKKILQNKNKTVPILSFPSVQLMGITVDELISSSEKQAEGMKTISDRCDIGVSLNMMDLSVEAEAFGCEIQFSKDEVPTVVSGVIDEISQAADIIVPKIGAGRTSLYIEGVKKAKAIIKDKPVFCGIIGPYSLAGRIFDMTELMMECFDSPQDVEVLVSKVSEFLIEYIKAFKAAGADGVIIAEPAAGLLSPQLAEQFSNTYLRKIISEINDEDFIICYHNCGNAVSDMVREIASLDVDIFHFGNAVDMEKLICSIPKDKIVMGNIDPILFKNATTDIIENEVERIFKQYSKYENFMISTGCDVPAEAKWENLDAYFKKVQELYINI